MGCITRLGCLVLLIVLACVAWLTRDRWLPQQFQASMAKPAPAWTPLSDAGADRTQSALGKLNQRGGQAFQTVSAADVASYIYRSLAKTPPATADSLTATVDANNQLVVRGIMPTELLGAAANLGPVASVLGDRAPVELSGTMRIVGPKLAEFVVQSVKVRDIRIPNAMIPGLISKVDRGPRPAGLDPTGLPLPIPASVGDIRVGNGKITLYKTAS